MKKLVCALGLHSWEKCTCRYCNKVRDGHHDFCPADEVKHICRQCGVHEPHDFYDHYDDVHDGSWDEWGPIYQACRYTKIYRRTICYKCGYEFIDNAKVGSAP